MFKLNWKSSRVMTLSVISGLVLLLFAAAQTALAAQAAEGGTANLSGSAKTVDQAEATAGSTLQYTIVLSNSGDALTAVQMTDTLPAEVAFVSGDLSPAVTNGIGSGGYSNGVITWTGTLNPQGYVELVFDVALTDTVTVGDAVINTAEITGTGTLITRSAETTVVDSTPTIYLPIMSRVIPAVTLQATAPNSNNEWTLFWGSAGFGITGYELQESNDPNFSSVTTYNLGSNTTSQLISHDPSVLNVYYYRVRAKVDDVNGLWSNVVSVTGQSIDLILQATRPNSANLWTLSWNNPGNSFSYELQESQNPNFTPSTSYNQAGTSQAISHAASPFNEYFYRVRAIAGGQNGPWSNVVNVIAGYRDDFDSNTTGWALRRTTYVEQVWSFYEPGQYVIQVDDSWDWGLASPMAKAPVVPYVIEYRSEPAHLGNLISHGVVFGGDWPGPICPDYSTIQGIYEHELCFNHFYNTNTIWFGDVDLKLLWERVDELIWCPSCGGSPMKRLGDIDPNATINLHADHASEWNDYRIEVRADSIRFYFNGNLEHVYNDTRWVNEPYFGVFASTDEYSNSTWRFDYISVMPLDQ